MATTLNNIAFCLYSLKRFDESLPYYEESMAIRRKNLGNTHPQVGQSLNNMAASMVALENYAAALPLYVEAVEIHHANHGDNHLDTLLARNDVARTLLELGRPAEALPEAQQAYSAAQQTLGVDHAYTQLTLSVIGRSYKDLARYDDALSRLERAAAGLQAALPTGHPIAVRCGIDTASTLIALQRFAEAEPLLAKAAAECATSPECTRKYRRLIAKVHLHLYESWSLADPEGNHQVKTARWRAKVSEAR